MWGSNPSTNSTAFVRRTVNGITADVDSSILRLCRAVNVWAEIDDSPDAAGVMQLGTGATVHQAAALGACSQHYSTYTKQSGRRYWRVVTMDSCVLRLNCKAISIYFQDRQSLSKAHRSPTF